MHVLSKIVLIMPSAQPRCTTLLVDVALVIQEMAMLNARCVSIAYKIVLFATDIFNSVLFICIVNAFY